jgi:hypothetical protein
LKHCVIALGFQGGCEAGEAVVEAGEGGGAEVAGCGGCSSDVGGSESGSSVEELVQGSKVEGWGFGGARGGKAGRRCVRLAGEQGGC